MRTEMAMGDQIHGTTGVYKQGVQSGNQSLIGMLRACGYKAQQPGLGVLADGNTVTEHRAAGSSLILPLGHPKDSDLDAQWKYKEKTFAIYFNGQFRITDAQQFSGRLKLDSDSLSVEVTDLQIQDSGRFSITVVKAGAQPPTKIINLTVYGLGVLADGNTVTERRAAGSSLIVPLGHPKDPDLDAQWKYKEKTFAIYFRGQLHIINELQFSGRLKLDSDSLSVEVTDLQLQDSGSYSIAIDKPGAQLPTKIINLTVYGSSFSVLRLLSSLMAVSPYLLVSIVLGVKCYRARAFSLGVLADENTVTERRAAGSSIILPLGYPKESVVFAEWKYEGRTFALYNEGQLHIINELQFSGRLKLDSDSLSVEVTDLQLRDSGSYSITVYKHGAQPPTKMISLTVYGPLKIKIESSQTWVESTDSCEVHLLCRAGEDQSVSYTWSGYKTESGAELHFTLSPADGDVTLNCTAVGRTPFSVLSLLSSLMAVSPYLLVSIVLGVKCYRARGMLGQFMSVDVKCGRDVVGLAVTSPVGLTDVCAKKSVEYHKGNRWGTTGNYLSENLEGLGVLADGNTVTERRAAGSSLILPLGYPKESVSYAEWKYKEKAFAIYFYGQLRIINTQQFRRRLKLDSDTLSVEVTDLQLQDSGSYSIAVDKPGAQPTTKIINLTVYGLIEIEIESSQTWVESTDSCKVHLVCRAPEDQNVSYTWSGYKTESGGELHFSLSPADGDVTLNCTAVGRLATGTNTTSVKCNPNKTPPVSPYLLVSIILGVKCYRARAKPEEENSL
ncbi:hypothetical protein NFI96_008164 [Prochilodus magdalenae]|nr:hypothetical protein NFI96_008164 [Prochilodus magdalenae]